MAKKSDLEALHNTYRMYAGQAAAAVRSLSLGSAIDHAVHSLDSLPGYTDYETRYAKPPQVALPTLAVIFEYSPAMFRSDAVHKVATLLTNNPKLSNKLGRDLALEVQTCRLAMAAARREWDRCAGNPPRLGDPPTASHLAPTRVLKVWTQLGLLVSAVPAGRREPRRFSAPLSGSFRGVCPRCGVRADCPKLAMLSPLTCGSCGAIVEYVILHAIDPEVQARC